MKQFIIDSLAQLAIGYIAAILLFLALAVYGASLN